MAATLCSNWANCGGTPREDPGMEEPPSVSISLPDRLLPLIIDGEGSVGMTEPRCVPPLTFPEALFRFDLDEVEENESDDESC